MVELVWSDCAVLFALFVVVGGWFWLLMFPGGRAVNSVVAFILLLGIYCCFN